MEDKLKKFVQQHRGEFDKFTPSDDVWNRLERKIKEKQATPTRPITKRWWIAAASVAALVTLTLSLFLNESPVGHVEYHANTDAIHQRDSSREQRNSSKEPIRAGETATMQAKRLTAGISDEETAPLRTKTAERASANATPVLPPQEEPNVLALLGDGESAANRMKGLLLAKESSAISAEELEQIERVVLEDPNSNVRLAGMEVLMDYLPAADRKQKLEELFVAQTDVALQMELMQVFTQDDSLEISLATAEKLQEIATDPMALDVLKDQAYAVLMKTW